MSTGRSSVRVTSLCSVSLSGDWTTTTETENTQTDVFSLCSDVTVVLYRCKGFSFDKDVGALWTREHSDFSYISGSRTNQTERNRRRKQSQSTRPESKHENLSVSKLNLNQCFKITKSQHWHLGKTFIFTITDFKKYFWIAKVFETLRRLIWNFTFQIYYKFRFKLKRWNTLISVWKHLNLKHNVKKTFPRYCFWGVKN